jgi:hypothetical protein
MTLHDLPARGFAAARPVTFNEDSLQFGSLVSRARYHSLAMKFAGASGFGQSGGAQRQSFGYHVEA